MELPVSVESDIELWQQAASGDRRCFDKLYFRYWSLLLSEAFKVLKVHQEAEDVVQELFVSIYERLSQVEPQDIKAYLLKANRYAIYKKIRSYASDEKYQYNLEQLEISGIGHLPYDNYEYEQLESAIKKAIDRLPEKCREVFLLSRDYHLSYSEIASKLGISERTVENQVSKALRQLRQALSRDYSHYFKLLILIGI